jgi:hypothetical protein
VPILLCVECIAAYGIDADSALPLGEGEPGAEGAKLPYVCPACIKCVVEYENAHGAFR